MKTHLQVANAAIGLLVDIGARLRPFVDVEDDLLYLSKVESADTHSLQDLLVNYLSSDSLRNNVSLSYLKLQILQSGPNSTCALLAEHGYILTQSGPRSQHDPSKLRIRSGGGGGREDRVTRRAGRLYRLR